jgi:hypothetical protein
MDLSDFPVMVASGLRVRVATLALDGAGAAAAAGEDVPVANVELLE